MNDKPNFFLAASGILVAVLLVWAQIWIDAARQYQLAGYKTFTADVGLSYVYYAVVASIIAFVIVLCRHSVDRITKVLFGFSVVTTFLLVCGSLFAAVTKAASGISILIPSECFVTIFSNDILRNLTLFMIPGVVFIILLVWFYFVKASNQ